MVHYVVIREATTSDISSINEVIRGAYLSNVFTTWCAALTKEITFQLIVLFAAVMFIFVGIPFLYCVGALPLVLMLVYLVVYSALTMKAAELAVKRPLQCWVAELYEPFYFFGDPKKIQHFLVSEEKLKRDIVDLTTYRRKIIGTVSVTKSFSLHHSLWLYKLGVQKEYRRKGIATALVKNCQSWALDNRYDNIHLALAECQELARHALSRAGFEMKQMYHKQVLGSIIMVVMYQLQYQLKATF